MMRNTAKDDNSAGSRIIEMTRSSNGRFTKRSTNQVQTDVTNALKEDNDSQSDTTTSKAMFNNVPSNNENDESYNHLLKLLDKSQIYANLVASLTEKNLNKEEPLSGVTPISPSVPPRSATSKRGIKRKLVASENSSKRQNKRTRVASASDEEVSVPSAAVASTSQAASDTSGQIDLVDGKRLTSLGLLVDPSQPIYLEGAILRDYQLTGFKWLKVLFETGMNGILADEMGLGKTVQVIALICHLYHNGVIGPFLIIGPLSTVPNWALEFEKFSPQIPVVVYHGPIEQRITAQSKISRSHKIGDLRVYPVVLTSYDMPRFDKTFLHRTNWKYIIVDEGHRLKNPNTVLTQLLKTYKTVNKVLLTGTPIQNNLEELWSLLNFLLPKLFDSLTAFESRFSVKNLKLDGYSEHLIQEERKRQILTKFHTILCPFLLRRVKADVNLELPPKTEYIIKCPLTDTQLALYRAVMDESLKLEKNTLEEPEITHKFRNRREPVKFGVPSTISSRASKNADLTHSKSLFESPGLASLTYSPCPSRSGIFVSDKNDGRHYMLRLTFGRPISMLQKVVNHPHLVMIPVVPGTNITLDPDDNLITESGKMVILDSLLGRLKARNHKVVLFSTMVIMLDLIEDYLLLKKYRYCRLDGRTKIEDRRKSINEFNTDDDIFIYIISTRAGGLGINLCAADTVIIFDSDWNPQVDLQAQDRCHRIGQTRPVIVYKLVCPGTVDENIIITAHAKRKLEKLFIEKGGFDAQDPTKKNVSLEELKNILDEKIMSNETVIGNKDLSEAEWEKLLDRSFT